MICLKWWELALDLFLANIIWRLGRALVTGHLERRAGSKIISARTAQHRQADG